MRIAVYAPVFVRPTETFIYDATTELARNCEYVSVIAERRQAVQERPFEPVSLAPLPGRWSVERLAQRALTLFSGAPGRNSSLEVQRSRIRKILKRMAPDAVLANYGHGGATVAPVAAALSIPLMVSFHGADASRLARDPKWQRQYRDMFETAAAITGPSHYVRDRLIGLGCPPEKAHVLHYGIRTDTIQFRPPGQRYDGGVIRFLFIGRLAPKKDPVSLLESFRKTRDALLPKPSVLRIAGDGPMQREVLQKIRDLGIADSVELLGRLSHDQVIEEFGNSHIYVQHSVTAPDGDEEGLPVSITEALASGLPVVSTRHAGIPEAVIDGETGFVVAEKDVDGMAARMIELAESPALWDELGANGRALLEREFEMQTVNAQLRSILADIAGERPATGQEVTQAAGV